MRFDSFRRLLAIMVVNQYTMLYKLLYNYNYIPLLLVGYEMIIANSALRKRGLVK